MHVKREVPLLLFGSLLGILGLTVYFCGILFSIARLALHLGEPFRTWNQAVIWYSGLPCTLGLVLGAADLAFLLPGKRRRARDRSIAPISARQVTVALTAYNDEKSVQWAVEDFRAHPSVRRLIVVDNNSRDATAEVARRAGARVVIETDPGYGRCVYRCCQEALSEDDSELIVICEGDMTFRAADLEKLLAYIDHADIVNGTRIVEQLRDYRT